jgi:hypothetical protein
VGKDIEMVNHPNRSKKSAIIDRALASRVLEVVDAGLISGKGVPEPGKMCVEAAVCFAMGLPHSDQPACVSPVLRKLKISLNDRAWSSNAARAVGLRRLAIAQLGSVSALDEKAFLGHVVEMTIKKIVPRAMRSAARVQKSHAHKDALEAAAVKCETDADRASALEARDVARSAAYAAAYADADAAAASASAAYAASYDADAAAASASAAYAASYAADADAASAAYAYAARDRELSFYAEEVVRILIAMKAPGCEFLDLAPLAA